MFLYIIKFFQWCTAPGDYIGFAGRSLTFSPGSSVVCTPIFITNDAIPEITETFNFMIDSSQNVGIIVGTPSVTTVSILDGKHLHAQQRATVASFFFFSFSFFLNSHKSLTVKLIRAVFEYHIKGF